jgi:hypothetical protein
MFYGKASEPAFGLEAQEIPEERKFRVCPTISPRRR